LIANRDFYVEIIAISSDGPFYQIWNWRFDRFLTVIR